MVPGIRSAREETTSTNSTSITKGTGACEIATNSPYPLRSRINSPSKYTAGKEAEGYLPVRPRREICRYHTRQDCCFVVTYLAGRQSSGPEREPAAKYLYARST